MKELEPSKDARKTQLQLVLTQNFVSSSRLLRADQKIECDLYYRKWFDYRIITPMEATLRFREQYQEIYRWKYSANIDSEEAQLKTGVGKKLSQADFTSFWRARQFADRLGVTYEIFLEAAFEVAIRRGWSRLPHINQLYGSKNEDAIALAVETLWAEYIGSRFTFSDLPHYREDAYGNMAAQNGHRLWVIEQLKARHGSAFHIGRACFVHRILPETQALREFGQERLDQARMEVFGDEPAPEAFNKAQLLLPSCFGLPGAPSPSRTTCNVCPSLLNCLKMEAAVIANVVERCGSDDPILSRRRALQNRRATKHRKRKALRAFLVSNIEAPKFS